MQFRILGPLEIEDDGRSLAPRGSKPRALLALLLLHANEPVGADRLIEELWGDELPANAAKTLQIHISRLRKSLGAGGDGRLATLPSGYRLRVGDGELDRALAEALLGRGRGELSSGDAGAAAATFREALDLFRGPPLADFAYEPFAQAEIARLEDLRLQLFEGRVDADLALGRHGAVVAELERLVAENPLRERPREQLMLALYRAGRQADALAVYQDFRKRLDDELGLAPGPELRRLERAILEHEEGLAAPSVGRRPLGPRAGWRPGRRATGAAAVVVGAAAVAAALALRPSDQEGIPPRSLAIVDAAGVTLTGAVPLAGAPADVVTGRRAVFVAVPETRTVVVLDPRTRGSTTVGASVAPTVLAAGGGGIWVTDGRRASRAVARLGSERVYPLGDAEGGRGVPAIDAVAVARRAVWAAERAAPDLLRLDVRTGHVVAVSNRRGSFFEGDARRGLVVVDGTVWTSIPLTVHPQSERIGRLTRLDAETGAILGHVPLAAPPVALAAEGRRLWVALERGEQLVRVDRDDRVVSGTVRVPGGVVDVAAAGGHVWALGTQGVVSRIDPVAAEVTGTVDLGRPGVAIAAGHGSVWVAVP